MMTILETKVVEAVAENKTINLMMTALKTKAVEAVVENTGYKSDDDRIEAMNLYCMEINYFEDSQVSHEQYTFIIAV